ncbi:MAG: metalloregulator ArsR/SmtB family transcription factor [Bacteroidia bacterium]|nr:metalloregulator ArsR/SmtB family transcription factor [Bacteroidia bacterium]
MMKTKVRFENEKLQYSAILMKALAHPLRLKILEFIDIQGVINVNKIYNTLKIEQSVTSQHLKLLRMAGVVKARKEGKFMHYQIDYTILERAERAVNNFLNK